MEGHQSLRKRQSIMVDKSKRLPAAAGSARVRQSFSSRSKPLLEVPEENDGHSGGAESAATSSGLTVPDSGIPSRSRHRPLPSVATFSVLEDDATTAPSAHPQPALDDGRDKSLLVADFDPRKHIAAKLAEASPEEIAQYADHLKQHVVDLERKEQEAIQRNYQTMLQAAREIADLPPEIAQLRKLVGDLSLVAKALRQDAEAQTLQSNSGRSLSQASIDSNLATEAAGGVKNNRNSILMLTSAWAEDLMRLFKRVEGAQKYLPAVAGRHIVLESDEWYELNNVTLQPMKPVTLFLLNDHLLIATQKRQRTTDSNAHRPLIVDQCWPLAEVKIKDLGAEVQTANARLAIQALRGKSKCTFRAPSPQALSGLLSEYEHTRVTLNSSGSGNGLSNGRSVSGRHSRNPSASANMEPTRSRPLSVASTHSVEAQREAAKVVADIDVEIAHRRYNRAVELCLGNENNPLVERAVEERTQQVGKLLLERAELAYDEPASLVDTIRLLAKLGMAQQAREAFLNTRSDRIKLRASTVHFGGDIVSYVSQMAVIYFQLIRATVDIYRQAFPNKEDSSTIVEWTKRQVDDYVSIFNRQLYRIGHQTRIYMQCVEVTRQECKHLQEIGLDMDFLLSYVWS